MKIVKSMKKRNVIFIVSFLLLLAISLTVYFLFLKKPAEIANRAPFDSKSKVTWNSLQERAEVLSSGGYPEPLLAYLDTIHGKERYEWSGDRERTFAEIQTEHPGEIGSVLYAIYVAYSFYLEDLEALEMDHSRTNWEKLKKREELREHYFRGKLKRILFPEHPSQKTLELFYYAEDYAQKHPQTFGSERKRHLNQKRKQIYGNVFLNILNWEDNSFQNKILAIIYQRELGIMNDLEKAKFLEAKLRELKDDHFWN